MRALYCLLIGCACVLSCRQEYDPKAKSLDNVYLVVEANLDPGPDSTIVRITRSFFLDDTSKLRTENNAIVKVEGEDNTTRALIPKGNGYYVSANLNLTIGTGYRLFIKTIDGKEYASAFVKARTTPAIDSVNWEVDNNGVSVYVNTHDPTGNSRYYRWSFDETWEIISQYYSYYVYDPVLDEVLPRNFPDQEIYHCWKYDTISSLFLGNSIALGNDIIKKASLHFVPRGSEKMAVRYSVNVRQWALDKEAYQFYEMMKKNTETIGLLFSPQPVELKGNIQCLSEPGEYVLGYVTASARQVKRLFIPSLWPYPRVCYERSIHKDERDSIRIYFNNGGRVPYDYDFFNGVYWYSKDDCVDCRYRGGKLLRPSFW